MNAQELKELLLVLKEFDVVEYDTPELKLRCQFSKPAVEKQSRKIPMNQFPEAMYAGALKTPDITPEEMQALGFAGVIPNTPKS